MTVDYFCVFQRFCGIHKGTTLTKAEIEVKIASGKCRHEVKMIGNAAGQKYVTKYVVDLAVEPMITEIRIYADKEGVLHIPKEYRSDVTYGANVMVMQKNSCIVFQKIQSLQCFYGFAVHGMVYHAVFYAEIPDIILFPQS